MSVVDDDITELLAHLQRESDHHWRTAQAHRYVYPAGIIKRAQMFDRWIAAIRRLTAPKNVETPTDG